MENPNFLKQKYNLHNAPEVKNAAKRTEARTGEKVSQNPADQIQNYLDRFKEIIERKDPEKRKRGIAALKKVMLDKFVTKYEDVSESYWKSQENIMRERGQGGDWSRLSEKEKEKAKRNLAEGQLADQEASLEQWIDYLACEDSSYMPDYLKYWVFRSVSGLQEYDKDTKEFRKRTSGDIKRFPDLNHEALSYLIDSVQKKYKGENPNYNYDIQPEDKERFQQYLKQENFSKLYSWAVEQINPIPEHLMQITEGEWIKYNRGSDYRPLVRSIQGKGTGWCTAGENTAKSQLGTGDFYVYYTLDEEQKPTVPRVAIRMEGKKIAEVRGVAYKQNLDPFMGDVVAKKLEEFPDKEEYLKKDNDMKQLTEIEKKTKAGQELNKKELIFLYEIDSKIHGFGYRDDPRIEELRSQRSINEDMLIIFECTKKQVARNISEINKDTRAYVGEWNVEVFQVIRNYPKVTNLYESFPDKKIFMLTLETNPEINSSESVKKALDDKNIYRFNDDNCINELLGKPKFSQNKEQYNLVRFSVKQLGLKYTKTHEITIDEIYQKAKELMLELCPDEVGPQLRLQYPGEEEFLIASEPILYGNSRLVFRLGSITLGSWDSGNYQLFLNASYLNPSGGFPDSYEFVFRFRRSETKKP